MRAFLITAALLLATPAIGQSAGSSATLRDATQAAPNRVIVDGATWRCEGTSCTATGGSNQPALRACRRVVAKVGAVSAFTHKGVVLDAETLAACNA